MEPHCIFLRLNQLLNPGVSGRASDALPTLRRNRRCCARLLGAEIDFVMPIHMDSRRPTLEIDDG